MESESSLQLRYSRRAKLILGDLDAILRLSPDDLRRRIELLRDFEINNTELDNTAYRLLLVVPQKDFEELYRILAENFAALRDLRNLPEIKKEVLEHMQYLVSEYPELKGLAQKFVVKFAAEKLEIFSQRRLTFSDAEDCIKAAFNYQLRKDDLGMRVTRGIASDEENEEYITLVRCFELISIIARYSRVYKGWLEAMPQEETNPRRMLPEPIRAKEVVNGGAGAMGFGKMLLMTFLSGFGLGLFGLAAMAKGGSKYQEKPYKDESEALGYFMSLTKINMRVVNLGAMRKFHPQLTAPEAEKLIGILKELAESIRQPGNFANPKERRRLRQEMKEQLLKAIALIEKANEPAANACISAAIARSVKEFNLLRQSRLQRPRRRISLWTDYEKQEYWLRKGVVKSFPVAKGESVNMTVYRPQRFKSLFEASRSCDDSIDTELEDWKWLKEAVRIIDEVLQPILDRAKSGQLSPEDIRRFQQAIVPILDKLANVIKPEKELARFCLELLCELAEYGNLASTQTILWAAKTFFESRISEVESIIRGLKDDRTAVFREAAKNRKKSFQIRLSNILAWIEKQEYEKASGACFGLTKAKMMQIYLQEPQYAWIKKELGKAGGILKGNTKDSSADRKKKAEAAAAIVKSIMEIEKVSSVVSKFMQDLRDYYVEQNLKGNCISRQEAFDFVFRETIKKTHKTRGAPLSPDKWRVWYARFYQAAFIPLNIDNPQKSSETKRIPNPLFNAVSIAIKLQEKDRIESCIKLLTPKAKFPNTRQALKKLSEKEFISRLSDQEKLWIIAGVAADYNLDENQRAQLSDIALADLSKFLPPRQTSGSSSRRAQEARRRLAADKHRKNRPLGGLSEFEKQKLRREAGQTKFDRSRRIRIFGIVISIICVAFLSSVEFIKGLANNRPRSSEETIVKPLSDYERKEFLKQALADAIRQEGVDGFYIERILEGNHREDTLQIVKSAAPAISRLIAAFEQQGVTPDLIAVFVLYSINYPSDVNDIIGRIEILIQSAPECVPFIEKFEQMETSGSSGSLAFVGFINRIAQIRDVQQRKEFVSSLVDIIEQCHQQGLDSFYIKTAILEGILETDNPEKTIERLRPAIPRLVYLIGLLKRTAGESTFVVDEMKTRYHYYVFDLVKPIVAREDVETRTDFLIEVVEGLKQAEIDNFSIGAIYKNISLRNNLKEAISASQIISVVKIFWQREGIDYVTTLLKVIFLNGSPGVMAQRLIDTTNLRAIEKQFRLIRQENNLSRSIIKIERDDEAVGSGFVFAYDEEQECYLIVTNTHVVEGLKRVKICEGSDTHEEIGYGDVILRNKNENPTEDDLAIVVLRKEEIKGKLPEHLIELKIDFCSGGELAVLANGAHNYESAGVLARCSPSTVYLLGAEGVGGTSGSPYLIIDDKENYFAVAINSHSEGSNSNLSGVPFGSVFTSEIIRNMRRAAWGEESDFEVVTQDPRLIACLDNYLKKTLSASEVSLDAESKVKTTCGGGSGAAKGFLVCLLYLLASPVLGIPILKAADQSKELTGSADSIDLSAKEHICQALESHYRSTGLLIEFDEETAARICGVSVEIMIVHLLSVNRWLKKKHLPRVYRLNFSFEEDFICERLRQHYRATGSQESLSMQEARELCGPFGYALFQYRDKINVFLEREHLPPIGRRKSVAVSTTASLICLALESHYRSTGLLVEFDEETAARICNVPVEIIISNLSTVNRNLERKRLPRIYRTNFSFEKDFICERLRQHYRATGSQESLSMQEARKICGPFGYALFQYLDEINAFLEAEHLPKIIPRFRGRRAKRVERAEGNAESICNALDAYYQQKGVQSALSTIEVATIAHVDYSYVSYNRSKINAFLEQRGLPKIKVRAWRRSAADLAGPLITYYRNCARKEPLNLSTAACICHTQQEAIASRLNGINAILAKEGFPPIIVVDQNESFSIICQKLEALYSGGFQQPLSMNEVAKLTGYPYDTVVHHRARINAFLKSHGWPTLVSCPMPTSVPLPKAIARLIAHFQETKSDEPLNYKQASVISGLRHGRLKKNLPEINAALKAQGLPLIIPGRGPTHRITWKELYRDEEKVRRLIPDVIAEYETVFQEYFQTKAELKTDGVLDLIEIFSQISHKMPVLTREQEQLLAEEKERGNGAARDWLALLNGRLIFRRAAKFNRNHPSLKNEILQRSWEALFHCAAGFKPLGYRFSTYFYKSLSHTLGRFIGEQGKQISLSEAALRSMRRIRRLEKECGTLPSSEEIAKALGCSEQKARDLLMFYQSRERSLNEKIGPNLDDDSFEDFLVVHPRGEFDPAVSLTAIQITEQLINDVESLGLSRRKKEIFLRLVLSDLTLEATGEEFQVGRQRVMQIKKEVIVCLVEKNPNAWRHLPQQFEEIRQAAAAVHERQNSEGLRSSRRSGGGRSGGGMIMRNLFFAVLISLSVLCGCVGQQGYKQDLVRVVEQEKFSEIDANLVGRLNNLNGQLNNGEFSVAIDGYEGLISRATTVADSLSKESYPRYRVEHIIELAIQAQHNKWAALYDTYRVKAAILSFTQFQLKVSINEGDFAQAEQICQQLIRDANQLLSDFDKDIPAEELSSAETLFIAQINLAGRLPNPPGAPRVNWAKSQAELIKARDALQKFRKNIADTITVSQENLEIIQKKLKPQTSERTDSNKSLLGLGDALLAVAFASCRRRRENKSEPTDEDFERALVRIARFRFWDFSFEVFKHKVRSLLTYQGENKDMVYEFVRRAVCDAAHVMRKGKKGRGKILGLAGEISGLYEILIKRNTTLARINLGRFKAVDEIVTYGPNHQTKEFDAESSNTVFEFKMHITLRKLYQQVIGIDSISESHLEMLTDDPRFAHIRNIVYFGEADFGFVVKAITEFLKQRPEIMANLNLTDRGLSVRLSLPEVRDFLLCETTIELARQEEARHKSTYLPTDSDWKDEVTQIIQAKIDQLQGEKFDVIIAVSNAKPEDFARIKEIVEKHKAKQTTESDISQKANIDPRIGKNGSGGLAYGQRFRDIYKQKKALALSVGSRAHHAIPLPRLGLRHIRETMGAIPISRILERRSAVLTPFRFFARGIIEGRPLYIFFLIFGIDQISKFLIRMMFPLAYVASEGHIPPVVNENALQIIPNFISFAYIIKSTNWFLLSLQIISFIVFIYKFIYREGAYKKEASRWTHWCVGLFLGGFLGNIPDNIYLQGTIDWIRIHKFGAFNIADIALILGG
ncbi:MAG: hypothetical protein FJZ11_00860, partial [Candidatus Omnitrophica bacterium]|nr:hypothetical protein [Candidatus Omnitrophota bacterium]